MTEQVRAGLDAVVACNVACDVQCLKVDHWRQRMACNIYNALDLVICGGASSRIF
jgi:hypothetical protein